MPYNQAAPEQKNGGCRLARARGYVAITLSLSPIHKDGSVIFCDVCIRKILDEQKAKKERKGAAE